MLIHVLIASLAYAHVSMFYSDPSYQLERPIRNADSPAGNGAFSVDGPCGGKGVWGGDSGEQKSSVELGETVTLKIQYNGGHKSPDNQFTVRFACGPEDSGPSEEMMRDATYMLPAGECTVLSCPEDGAYPCPAPQGNDFAPGYIMECPVPTSAAGQDCTFSILDQREWGGCVDVAVGRTIGDRTVYTLEESVGAYSYSERGVTNVNSPLYAGCCCAMDQGGEFDVSMDGDVAVVEGSFSMTCPDHEVMTAYGASDFSETFTNFRLLDEGNNSSWVGRRFMGGTGAGKLFEFRLVDKILYYTNIDTDTPMICDGMIKLDGEGSGTSQQVTSNCPQGYIDEDGNFQEGSFFAEAGKVGAFPFILLIIAIGICVCLYSYRKGQGKEEQMIPGVDVTTSRIPQGKGVQFENP